MKLLAKTNLFGLTILTLTALLIVVFGTVIINDIVYDLNKRLLSAEMENLVKKVERGQMVLDRSGVGRVRSYVKRMQEELLSDFKIFSFGQTGVLLVIAPPRTVVFPADARSREPVDPQFIDQIVGQKKGFIEGKYGKETRFWVFETVPEWGWLLALSITTDEMFEKRTEYLRYVCLMTLGILVVTAIASSLFMTKLVGRIRKTLSCVRLVEKGDLTARIDPLASEDEMRSLQRGINAMVARIQERTEDRDRAEAALRAAEAKYRSIVENAVWGIFQSTAEGRLVTANPALARILGYDSRGGLIADTTNIGRQWYADPTRRDEFVRILRECRIVHGFEAELHRKDGESIWASLHARAVVDEKGELVLIEGMLQDVTERKRAMEQIRTLNEELERRVVERTAELQAVNKELEDFAYVASHDLKAPLRAIGQLAAWIGDDYAHAIDEPGQRQLRMLLDRVRRMHNLIDGILLYSRIGRVREKHEDVDLRQIVRDAIDMVAPSERIRVSVQEELPSVTCEETRMRQVFQNLVDNAAKFMDKDAGEIKVTCEDDDSSWKFGVSDNGPGIDPKYHDKIFQIFQTLTPRDQFESTGMGLTLVKKIVEMNSGRIWVESEAGKGTTFYFTWPKKGTDA